MTVDPVHSEQARADRLTQIRSGLASRMRVICSDMPDDLFGELVDRMATVQLKYELHETEGTGSTR